LTGKPHDRRNGWTLYFHRAFRAQFDVLTAEVERLRESLDPKAFAEHPKARLLARTVKLILEDIPRDPGSAAYQLGNTLGPTHRHWRRAKFNQPFRLFFRYRDDHKVIVYAWMNDENTLRARGARNDPYAVFGRRLQAGDPPDSFGDLLSESS
jgi:toxin YhaV